MMRTKTISVIATVGLLLAGGVWLYAVPQKPQPGVQKRSQVVQASPTDLSQGIPEASSGLVATATPTIGTPIVTPTALSAGTSTLVTATVQISDPTLIPGSVNLLRLSNGSAQPIILGVMQSVGNGNYRYQTVVNETSPGLIQLQASGAFRGQLRRTLSQVQSIPVYGVLTDSVSGFTTQYPPTLYDLSSTTKPFGFYDLESAPNGVAIGGGAPEDGSNATTSGFSIAIQPAKYFGAFDINAWLTTSAPYSDVDSLTTTTVSGTQAYVVTFKNQVGAGRPTVVVYHHGYVYQVSYASTYAIGSIFDQDGLNAFNSVLSKFQFSN
jgi:hypothetical protein